MSSLCAGDLLAIVLSEYILECGLMPNVMATLPNIGGTLC